MTVQQRILEKWHDFFTQHEKPPTRIMAGRHERDILLKDMDGLNFVCGKTLKYFYKGLRVFFTKRSCYLKVF